MTVSPVTKLWAFVDTAEGEGILAAMTSEGFVPMITGKRELIELMRPNAEAIARHTGHNIELREYATYSVLEVLENT